MSTYPLHDHMAKWQYHMFNDKLHPMVYYYPCSSSNVPSKESVVVISNDLNPDAAAVHCFTKATIDHLRQKIPVNRFIEFTNSCAAQYKSKVPFMDIQTSADTLGVAIERNFFGSRHGKNPSDGESAVVKNAATQAVKTQQTIIQNPRDLFEFCKMSSQRGQDLELHPLAEEILVC
ncbi:hypothetical protein RRG08_011366 [Elysia crispata]|uniref:Uncharacterized protein n=1 Tax=Elysia crispata TaxID=231223 RepID=A0AAE0ZMD2_9GAST|nr:hypothetical protein RRG08_011366 [Elysia crispata]